jgi:hypothetical protein
MTPKEIAAARKVVTNRLDEIKARRRVLEAEASALYAEEGQLLTQKADHEAAVFAELEKDEAVKVTARG